MAKKLRVCWRGELAKGLSERVIVKLWLSVAREKNPTVTSNGPIQASKNSKLGILIADGNSIFFFTVPCARFIGE